MSKMAKRGIVIGLLLLMVSAATIYFTIDVDSLATISTFNPISLVLAAIALCAGMYFDGLRLQRLVRMSGYSLSLRAVLRVIFGNYFMALLTPGASGGVVAQVLILRSYQVPVATGGPIVFVRTVFSILFLITILPFIFMYEHIDLPYISSEALLQLSLVLLVMTFLGTYILQTQWMKSMVYQLTQRINGKYTKVCLAKLGEFNQGLGLLYVNPVQSLIVFLESGASLLCLYAIAPALMWAFTDEIALLEIINRMIVLNLILYFAPTPGGAGVAEGLFVYLFTSFLPVGTVGIVAVVWRIMAEYVPFFVGMYSVLTLYGKHVAQAIQEDKRKE